MTTTSEFTVSCDHRDATWAMTAKTVTVDCSRITGMFSVMLEGFGCSREYDTAPEAIRELLYASGCRNVLITPNVW